MRGVSGVIFSIFGLWFSNKVGKKLDIQTVGEVAKKMTRDHYVKSTRNPETFNKNEVEKIIIDWFNEYLLFDNSKEKRSNKLVG